MELGLIHIYCGDGKGKTTSAIGLGVRAAGRGKKVLLTQFLKNNNTGELISIEKLKDNFEVLPGVPVNKFSWQMTLEEKEKAKIEHTERFKEVINKSIKENYDLLILDEIIGTINLDFISLDRVIEFLENKPNTLEVVLTGRDPNKRLIDLADYVSEIRCIKHPFNKGIASREGIEL